MSQNISERPVRLSFSNSRLPDRVGFSGKLASNELLKNAVHLGKGKFRGAESILFVNDTMYSGLLNGQIAWFDTEGNAHAATQAVNSFDVDKCGKLGDQHLRTTVGIQEYQAF
jgi:hypothetical protein